MKFVSAGFDVSCRSRVAADRLVEPAAFGFSALIAPDDRRASTPRPRASRSTAPCI